MIDTHAHIYLEEFKSDLDAVIGRSMAAGIEKIFMPNVDSETIDDMMKATERYPGYCIPMMGLHPGSVDERYEERLELVERWLSKGVFAAVGEIGIDLYWDRTFENQQKEAFKRQVELAKKFDLPIVVHHRNAFDEAFKIVKQLKDNKLTGIFHCFTGTKEEADKLTSLGFYLGIGGVATFKNGGLDKSLPGVNIERIVLETDSPYLAPAPYRGKRNEPAYLELVAKRLGEILNMETNQVIEVTSANARNIFKVN